MAKRQSPQLETSSPKKEKKVKRRKTDCEQSELSPPAEVTEVKKKKKKSDVNNTSELLKVKKKKKTKQKEKEAETLYDSVPPVEAEESGDVEEGGMEGEDDLSPEERRVLERKLKKIRKKEEKKKLKEEKKSEKEESKSSIAKTQALEYLKCWSEKREEWKFQKTRQVWLLQHMFDSEKVSDANFTVLLSYLEGLQGVARETTVQKAEALARWGGQDGAEVGAAEAEKRALRAKEVIQMLS
ncbi:uncharacterized protein C7orf50 homolog [Hoplias malabaricus]|uniref:uncharacterized protein C7orf50 homolog n=1 Tax=Hoplias malabaricus TaxID=27720 RepID=UPI003462543A